MKKLNLDVILLEQIEISEEVVKEHDVIIVSDQYDYDKIKELDK